MPICTFVLPDGARVDVEVQAGETVLDAARAGDVDIEGACGGAMACATCHVHVEQRAFDALPPASVEEEEMLELAEDLAPTSRLGCQLKIERDLEVAPPPSSLL